MCPNALSNRRPETLMSTARLVMNFFEGISALTISRMDLLDSSITGRDIALNSEHGRVQSLATPSEHLSACRWVRRSETTRLVSLPSTNGAVSSL